MKYLKKMFENFSPVIELVYKPTSGPDDMLNQTSHFLNFTQVKGLPYGETLDKVNKVIMDNMDPSIFNPLPGGVGPIIGLTHLISKTSLKNMFRKVYVQEGSDGDDEYVVALSIKGRLVLLLADVERGSSIRFQEPKKYPLDKEEFEIFLDLLKELCHIFNDRYSPEFAIEEEEEQYEDEDE